DLVSPLRETTASVGHVVNDAQIQDLPLRSRNVLDLAETQPGLLGGNFSGARIGALNVMRDGINITDQFVDAGLNSAFYTSTDLVEEFRIITSPVDAELGRGSGQVQTYTRGGTNGFHGSLYDWHHNTALTANTWFNNQQGVPRNFVLSNQFGAR